MQTLAIAAGTRIVTPIKEAGGKDTQAAIHCQLVTGNPSSIFSSAASSTGLTMWKLNPATCDTARHRLDRQRHHSAVSGKSFAMNDASFQLNKVCRRLGDSFRLRIDDLTVRRGEVFALLGPTGAGNTTLMRLLTGLEYPDEGVIQLNGTALDRTSPLSCLRDITMVHQRPILLNGSVEANVAYGLRARRRAADSKVKDVLNRLELGRLAGHDARLLSGGQMQLVALARALVLEPEVLLLDEPTANLDPAYVALVEKVIGESQAMRGMTVVWATHNLFQARRVSHWVTLLLDGGVVEVAENAAFFATPNDPRTVAFIQGKMVY